jgi:hypothetical protein
MSLIGHLFAILLGLCLAAVAAGLVVVLAVLFPEWSELALGPLDETGFTLVLAFGLIFVSGVALVPALIVVALTEAFGIRQPLAYAAGGALSGAACYLGLVPFDTDTMRFVGIIRRDLEIMSGAGIIAGLVYWLVAGRNAGRWRETPPQPPSSSPPPAGMAAP